MPRGGMNPKAVAANEKKAAAQALKDAEQARQQDAATTADWDRGSNQRGAARADSAASKADDAARKRQEKAALLAAEEEATEGSGKAIKSKFGAATKKKGGKSKKKNDLSLLEDSLIGDAEKKTKEKKKMERIKREKEAALVVEKERKAKAEQDNKDPLMSNTDSMLGMMAEDNLGRSGIGRSANVASMLELQASGVDSALSALSVSGGGDDRHPEKRMKAAYKAYEEKMMPEMKADYPGLKRQQYLDKIFTSWKKSPENPKNQM